MPVGHLAMPHMGPAFDEFQPADRDDIDEPAVFGDLAEGYLSDHSHDNDEEDGSGIAPFGGDQVARGLLVGKNEIMQNGAAGIPVRELDIEPEFEDSCVDRSCFIFGKDGCTRQAAMYTVGTADEPNPVFEFFVILAIIVNSVFLAMYVPTEEKDSPWNMMLDQAGMMFTLVFTVEMFFKIVAMGFCFGDGAYLASSGWNWIDFVVVVTGYTDFIPNYENDLGVFRTVRLLRPLRTITAIKVRLS